MRPAPSRLFALVLALGTGLATALVAQTITPRDGWAIHASEKSYDDLLEDVKAAARASGLGVVTEAGPTEVAAARGVEIPGNRVVGFFNNEFAVRILGLSTAAMIEAPIRVYITEGEDGLATLAYKTPSAVFAPYVDEGGAELEAAAAELDTLFAELAALALD